jgi:hypothetical protein
LAFQAEASVESACRSSVVSLNVIVMTVYVTAISPGDASDHGEVERIRWLSSSDSTSNTMTKQQAVDWVRNGNSLVVAGEKGPVAVLVVDANPPYLRTAADGSYTNNLLALPRF